MNKFIEAFTTAIKQTFRKNFYKKILAYSCIIAAMKYDDGNEDLPVEKWKTNDKYWTGELPSIYMLDNIVDQMNSQRDDINKTFKLKVDHWNRNEVRHLMNSFEQLYNGYCRINNHKLSLLETIVKFDNSISSSFWQIFKIMLKS